MYALEIKEEADKIFHKLSKKNRRLLEIIGQKIDNIRKNPQHSYKFLRKPLQGFNRVHVDKNFVLIFKMNHKNKKIIIYYFNHHDKIYNWRPE